MLVCVDTNVMLHAFARGSDMVALFKAIGTGRIGIAVSTSILLEYEEIAARQGGAPFAARIMALFGLVSRVHGTVHWVNPSFQFHIVTADPDDNKFTDCAIAAGANYVITSDAHFAPLSGAGYKPQPIAPQDFIARFLKAGG